MKYLNNIDTNNNNLENVGVVKFANLGEITPSPGHLHWSEANKTLSFGTINGSEIEIGQELIIPILNQTGSTISNGAAVGYAGTVGASGIVSGKLFIANGTDRAEFFLGLATHDIPNESIGHIALSGKIRGIDTSAYSAGDLVYVSPTVAGGLTKVKPTAPNQKIMVGVVISSSATVGAIEVRINRGSQLGDDHNSEFSTPAAGHTVFWNELTNRWENKLHIGAGGTVHAAATTSVNGFMSSTDKGKLDGISANARTGTVTSVAMTTPTGLSVTGSPITTSGTLALGLTSGYSIPTTAKQTNWDSAFTHSTSAHAPSSAQANQTITSGNGMTAWTATSGNLTVSLGTPSTLTTSSTNATTATSHTHSVTFPVTSVAGKTGAVTLDPADIGAAASSHTHTLSDITDSGSIASINTNGSTANYLRGDGSWVTPPNTTYSVISTAEIDAGTATTARTISGARVKYILDKKADASHTHLPADITQDASNRFVTDAQITTWNAKGTSNLTLGTTSSTAYRGDYGNTAYTHSQSTHAPTNAQANQTLTSGNGMAAWTATSGNLTISLGTPSSITSTSTNSLTSASHTHALGDIDCGTF